MRAAAICANERQRRLVIERLNEALGGLAGRRICLLGLAFKPNTNDVRESPAVHIARADEAFDDDGRLKDPRSRSSVEKACAELLRIAAALRA